MELPDFPEPGRYRVSGFGYGTSTRLHKVLVAREERVVSPHDHDRKSHRAMYRAKELLVCTLGAGGPSSPDDDQRRLRPVLPELDAKISGKSVYLDGKVYLLADYSRVLVFDVNDETVAAVDLPGECLPGKRRRHARSKLMEVSGRLCVATATDDRLSLWLLTPDQQWVRLCESRCGDVNAAKLAGAWDCGGVVLLYFVHRYSKVAHMRMYDTRNDEEFSRLAMPRAVAEQGGAAGRVLLCWGYKPTLVSPGSIVGAPPRRRCAGGVLAASDPQLERDVDAGRERTLEVVCFMNLLLYITRKLPDNAKDVIKELKRKSLPLSL